MTDNDIWPADMTLEILGELTKSYWTPDIYVRVHMCVYIHVCEYIYVCVSAFVSVVLNV